jgi:hypothetical protein
LGEVLPNRLWPNDETKPQTASPAPKPAAPKKVYSTDNDGHKDISEPDFFYNREPGTITVKLPTGFSLKLGEMKNEQQDVVAKERNLTLDEPATLQIRRAVVKGQPKIALDSCNNVALLAELEINQVPGIEWPETGKSRWVGLPDPLKALLSFAFGEAIRNGKLVK